MARLPKVEGKIMRDFRNVAIECNTEAPACEDQIEFDQLRQCPEQHIRVLAGEFGAFSQNALDFFRLAIGDLSKLVVELQHVQRLDKQRCAAAGFAVNHATNRRLVVAANYK